MFTARRKHSHGLSFQLFPLLSHSLWWVVRSLKSSLVFRLLLHTMMIELANEETIFCLGGALS